MSNSEAYTERQSEHEGLADCSTSVNHGQVQVLN